MQRRDLLLQGLSILGGAWLSQSLGCRPALPPLRIATNIWTGYESLYVARDWHSLPSNVQLVELQNASQSLAVMRTGTVDAAALTLDEALSLRSRGVRVRVVGVFDTSFGADALVSRSIATLSGLRGARIGVENNALGAYMLSRILERAQLTTSDVQVVRLEVSAHERAFRNGEVDAVITFDPFRTRLIALGAKVLFDSRQLPGEIVDVLVVHTRALEDAAIRTSLGSVLSAVDQVVRTLRPGSATFGLMAKRLGLSAKEVETAAEGIRLCTLADMAEFLDGPKPVLASRAAMMSERMRQAGLLSAVPDLADLVDDRVLREARA